MIIISFLPMIFSCQGFSRFKVFILPSLLCCALFLICYYLAFWSFVKQTRQINIIWNSIWSYFLRFWLGRFIFNFFPLSGTNIKNWDNYLGGLWNIKNLASYINNESYDCAEHNLRHLESSEIRTYIIKMFGQVIT